MKKYLFFVFAVLLFTSCLQNGRQKQLISDREQTIGGTKTDLSLKIKSLKKVKTITAKDSCDYMMKGYEKWNLDSINTEINRSKDMYKLYSDSAAMVDAGTIDLKDSYFHIHKEYYNNMSGIYYSNVTLLERAKEYYENPSKTLANIWNCTYTIKNPFLNNIEQELTKQYLFNADNSYIIDDLSE